MQARADEGPWTILLVDDEPDVRAAYSSLLETSLDAHVVTAESAAAALELLPTTPVDLIVSDYRMPAMDGLEFLAQAKAVAPGVPLVLLTAFPDAELKRAAIHSVGVRRFLSKALSPPELVDEVREALASA